MVRLEMDRILLRGSEKGGAAPELLGYLHGSAAGLCSRGSRTRDLLLPRHSVDEAALLVLYPRKKLY